VNLFLFVITLLLPIVAACEVVVAVNGENPVVSIPAENVRRIFLGEQTHWENSGRIVVMVMPFSSQEHREFTRNLLGISSRQHKRVIEKKVTDGDIKAFEVMDNYYRMFEAIKKETNAIGYIDGGVTLYIEDNIRIIKVHD
jgi:ABC-type phosphate transport system substrate-binding protein